MQHSKNTIKEKSRKPLGIRSQVSRAMILALLFVLPLLAGCPNRQEIMAEAWLHRKIPSNLQTPQVCAITGIYRKINDSDCPEGVPPPCEEFLSACSAEYEHYLGFNTQKFNEILDKLIPEGATNGSKQNSLDSGN